MKKKRSSKSIFSTSVLLALFALVCVTAATLAWMSIANTASIRSMDIDITAGEALRFDTLPHNSFEDYRETLSTEQIYKAVSEAYGFDPYNTPLEPVTTDSGSVFYLQNGEVRQAESGSYLKFTLHFIARCDMTVHLSSANSSRGADGTLVTSKREGLPRAMRMSFTREEQTAVYDPGAGSGYTLPGGARVFALPAAQDMRYTKDTALFRLKALTDTPVTVCIWLEGTDEECDNSIRNGDFAIRMRFVGTDENNVPYITEDDVRNRNKGEGR